MPRLVLASGSPRRQQLLSQLGLRFETMPSSLRENKYDRLPPEERVRALARAKALEVARNLSEAVVVGADTLVVCQGRVLGKPSSPAEAEAMLSFLSGKTHRVYTGVAVVAVPGKVIREAWECTEVRFRRLTPKEIKAYVATGEPLDKAGAYGIQGRGALLVEGIKGDFFNVVGLPLVKTAGLLEEFGIDIWGGPKADGGKE
ncbi:Maf family protein [Thermanaeromonas sp. C210]|uniref:Maf family protein n=1 Tax=Thermanaeromonas sp. C210 TaxID=2731925 RepID=UPI00155C5B45|nr:Maf family protein [Thermanaeromonas sp. C210]GFN22607.1 Maf-like protein [Thermanaeromonas sp. C210]